jgi:trimeric autotransporter adhesin
MSLAKTLLTAFVALSLAATASAQIQSATITGAVTDQSGAVAANAEVVITNSGTNVSYKTKSTEAGLYRTPYLQAGTSTVEVTVAGFVPFHETGLAIATDQIARVDVNLKAGAVGGSWTPATVEVAAQAAAQIQADSSAVTNATYAQVINDVPNVTQNPLFDAMLQNGVQPRNETSTSTLGDL